MKFTLKPNYSLASENDLLAVFCFEGKLEQILDFSSELNRFISEAAAKESFTGKDGEKLQISTKGMISSYKMLIVGLGKNEDFDIYKWQKSVSTAVRSLISSKGVKAGFILGDHLFTNNYSQNIIESSVEAVILSSYSFIKYKSEEERKKVRKIEEIEFFLKAGKINNQGEALSIGEIKGLATCFARDLVNEPPGITTPLYLANVARDIAKESGGVIDVQILDRDEVKKLGMDSYLGVARGSEEPPKFIILTYQPYRFKKNIAVIGKGITFDSGGLSIKSADYMETMKLDMAGAATVLSVFKYLNLLKPKVKVTGIIAACENMPSGKALKPGDILKSMNGKTIEVLNTDAEGRLTLADAFSYTVAKIKPDYMIDLATLTGACMVALGHDIAGMWGNDDKLNSSLMKAASESGEKVWLMPLEKEYKEMIKSQIADIKNVSSGRYGGAITASLFLSEFTGGIPWVHLDIAGPAFKEKSDALSPWGGSGFGVRLLLTYLSQF